MAGWACRSVVRLQAKITGDVRTPLRQPVPIGDMHREGFLEHCQQSLGNCGVVVVTLQVGDDLTLTIDVPLPTLNAAFRFLDVSLQEVRFMGTSYRSPMECGPLSSRPEAQRQESVAPR